MPQFLDSGVFSVIDTDSSIGVGWKLNFYTTGTSSRKDTYPTAADATALTNANANPVVVPSDGRIPLVWGTTGNYKLVLTDENDVVKETIDPVPMAFSGGDISAFMSTVLDDTSASALRTTIGLGTTAHGALAASTTQDILLDKSFSGDSGGTTDFRAWTNKVTLSGANSVAQVNCENIQLEMRHSAGTVTFGYGLQGYNRLGLSGSTTGAVTSSRGIEWHTANEGSGNVTAAYDFIAADVDLADGTGTIGTMAAFWTGNQGHATRVTTLAAGFAAANMTGGATTTASFYSEMASGTGKFTIYASGTAPSAHAGSMAIGSTTSPTDRLEVKAGYLKASSTSGFLSSGTYHELRTDNSGQHAVVISHAHASAPNGIRIHFPGASPDNNTQTFLVCDDSTTNRLIVYSDGDVVNHDNSYGAISDRKLKQGIKDARPQLADIRALRFRNYKFKTDVKQYGGAAKEQLGLIAQEAQDISPGLVRDDGGHLGIRYSVLYLKAVKALQELAAHCDTLESRIAALEARG